MAEGGLAKEQIEDEREEGTNCVVREKGLQSVEETDLTDRRTRGWKVEDEEEEEQMKGASLEGDELLS